MLWHANTKAMGGRFAFFGARERKKETDERRLMKTYPNRLPLPSTEWDGSKTASKSISHLRSCQSRQRVSCRFAAESGSRTVAGLQVWKAMLDVLLALLRNLERHLDHLGSISKANMRVYLHDIFFREMQMYVTCVCVCWLIGRRKLKIKRWYSICV